MCFKETGSDDVDSIYLVQDRNKRRDLVNMIANIKFSEFLESPRNHRLLKKELAPRS
jgi:hypothetical protein